MFSLIEVWRTSGKTQREFCKEKDIAYAKFHYWLKKHNEHGSPSDAKPGFMPVRVKDHADVQPNALELVYPDGRRLIFHQDVDPFFLRALLA